MSEQQQFQPGDRVKVTMELTVVGVGPGSSDEDGTVGLMVLSRWAELDHITVELVERTEPPREPGLHLCAYEGRPLALRWDGGNWRWPGVDERVVTSQDDEVTVIGSITLHEGVEL